MSGKSELKLLQVITAITLIITICLSEIPVQVLAVTDTNDITVSDVHKTPIIIDDSVTPTKAQDYDCRTITVPKTVKIVYVGNTKYDLSKINYSTLPTQSQLKMRIDDEYGVYKDASNNTINIEVYDDDINVSLSDIAHKIERIDGTGNDIPTKLMNTKVRLSLVYRVEGTQIKAYTTTDESQTPKYVTTFSKSMTDKDMELYVETKNGDSIVSTVIAKDGTSKKWTYTGEGTDTEEIPKTDANGNIVKDEKGEIVKVIHEYAIQHKYIDLSLKEAVGYCDFTANKSKPVLKYKFTDSSTTKQFIIPSNIICKSGGGTVVLDLKEGDRESIDIVKNNSKDSLFGDTIELTSLTSKVKGYSFDNSEYDVNKTLWYILCDNDGLTEDVLKYALIDSFKKVNIEMLYSNAPLEEIELKVNYKHISIQDPNNTAQSAKFTPEPGIIKINLKHNNTPPRAVGKTFTSQGFARQNDIVQIDKDKLLTDENGIAGVVDREQDFKDLYLSDVRNKDNNTYNISLLGNSLYVDLTGINTLISGDNKKNNITIQVKVTDGELESDWIDVTIPVRGKYIAPYLSGNLNINFDYTKSSYIIIPIQDSGLSDRDKGEIYKDPEITQKPVQPEISSEEQTETTTENMVDSGLIVAGSIGKGEPSFSYYIDSVSIGNGVKDDPNFQDNSVIVKPKVASASIVDLENGNKGISFKINNFDSIGEDTYFRVKVKIITDKGISTTTDVYIFTVSGNAETSRESLIYVHRKPVAIFGISGVERDTVNKRLKKASIINSNKSYDPDFINKEDGIYAIQWGITIVGSDYQYQKTFTREGKAYENIDNIEDLNFDNKGQGVIDGTINGYEHKGNTTKMFSTGEAWINNKIIEAIASPEYTESNGNTRTIVISLCVRDRCNNDYINGVWSDVFSVELGGAYNNPPTALFTINKSEFILPPGKYEIPDMTLTDNSFDVDGDPIGEWKWVLYDDKGTILKTVTYNNNDTTKLTDNGTDSFKKLALGYVKLWQEHPEYWTQHKPEFTIGLIVKEVEASGGKSSSEYKQTFSIYMNNDAPEFNIKGSKVYLVDPAEDGIKGDNYGTKEQQGVIPAMLTDISDTFHQKITSKYEFRHQNIGNTNLFNKNGTIDDIKTANDIKIVGNTTEKPFGETKTATELGFKPGVYQVVGTVTDEAKGILMIDGDSSMSTEKESTKADNNYLRVIPYLDLWLNYEHDGWVNSEYRKSDGKTLAELGLTVDDIAPGPGTEITLVGYTNECVDDYKVWLDADCNNIEDNIEEPYILEFTGEYVDITSNGKTYKCKEWKKTISFEDEGILDPDSIYELNKINLIAQVGTNWVRPDETDGKTNEYGQTIYVRTKRKVTKMPIEVVKLYDFNVTSVTDRRFREAFKEYLGTKTGAYVKDLAVDKNSFIGASGNTGTIRKGYAFYFNLMSRGLKDDNTSILITPHFYNIKEDGTSTELKAWIPNKDGKYEVYNEYYTTSGTQVPTTSIGDAYPIRYTTSVTTTQIGNISQLNLNKDVKTLLGSEQNWEGRYGIPVDVKFTTTDSLDLKSLYEGEVTVTFDIRGIKDNKDKYNYIDKKQWLKERAGYESNKEKYVTAEAEWLSNKKYIGAVIQYNTEGSVLDDYKTEPVWKE